MTIRRLSVYLRGIFGIGQQEHAAVMLSGSETSLNSSEILHFGSESQLSGFWF
jgi:hypothetical protein